MPDTLLTFVVFDAECVLCNSWVNFILRHEKDNVIRFATTQSPAGIKLAHDVGVSAADLHHSYLVIENDNPLFKSNAGLALLTHLKAPYRWLRIYRIIPRPIRDWGYDLVARNRYRWFGQQICFIPPPEQRHRFLET